MSPWSTRVEGPGCWMADTATGPTSDKRCMPPRDLTASMSSSGRGLWETNRQASVCARTGDGSPETPPAFCRTSSPPEVSEAQERRTLVDGSVRGRFDRDRGEDGQDRICVNSVQRAFGNLCGGPDPAVRRIMSHGPCREQTFFNGAGQQTPHVLMPVIPRDSRVGVTNGLLRALQPLQIKVGPTDQGSGYLIADIATAGIGQNAVQHPVVIAERLRGIDDPVKAHGLFRPDPSGRLQPSAAVRE